VASRADSLAELERQMDEEIYRLYGISAGDRAAIEEELRSPVTPSVGSDDKELYIASAEDSKEDTPAPTSLTQFDLAVRWVSYVVGIALSRFAPGVDGLVGQGQFTPDKANALRTLVHNDGPVVCEGGHAATLPAKVRQVLEIMCGEAAVQNILDTVINGKSLVDYLKSDFYKAHVRQYRNRPVYWLLQSPKRGYSVYVFHERMTADTLHLLRGTEYLGGAINAAHNQQADLHAALLAVPPGPVRKKIEKQLDAVNALLTDLEAFDANLAAVTGATNARGEVVGWRPEVDDGVLLNLAPLHTLMPSWAAEPRKAWEALARGDYDWAHTARRYWPDRVEEACRHNKSFAIAHGLPTD